VLVTDGEQRSALAVVRSLGRAGHLPFVCADNSGSLAGVSRYATGEDLVPSALEQPVRFVEAVRSLVRERDIEFILPLTEAAMLALLPVRDTLGATIPAPESESFRRISDKGILFEAARELGIAVPEQRRVSRDDAADWAKVGDLGYPLVLKPARSVAGGMKLSVRHAADGAELEVVRRSLTPEAYPLLVQRRIIGPGVGVFLLVWEKQTRAVFSHRRIREKPPAGGVSVYRESIAADPSLVAASRALLDRFDWQGVAMIEYKLDQATGTPYLMEINGRFWGSLQLAVDAGVDFPALLVALAAGERPAPVTSYLTGVRSRWWWGDVDHLLARLLHSDRELALPPDAPGRGRAVLDFLALWRPRDRNEVFRWNDPRPALRETLNWFRGQ
jgi:predicted ATP-grasp superfamily ATP-dependent carboligase